MVLQLCLYFLSLNHHAVIHCIVYWLPRLTVSLREAGNGTVLAVCCKTFLVVLSRYLEPLKVYSVQGSDLEWVESEFGRVATEMFDEDCGAMTGGEASRAVEEPTLEDDLSDVGAPRLAEDLKIATGAVWSILADGKCSSFPDVATTCGMLYSVLLRITHQHDSSLSKTCHQVLKVDGPAVDCCELWS